MTTGAAEDELGEADELGGAEEDEEGAWELETDEGVGAMVMAVAAWPGSSIEATTTSPATTATAVQNAPATISGLAKRRGMVISGQDAGWAGAGHYQRVRATAGAGDRSVDRGR
ncbi:hypothetical protein Lesp02_31580 [Lentzea sp. NBRC 105346]|uniref:hypothetical protein n=1 Tax=Lentzea sp. NBRC 105346 TaxID=3032205 RepID=UPI0024A079DB|nr:hypothetical protein [Lentzea sp. NBRC 105346]GLZ30969.1 hypothetical protein Lesp02_31580 [Lentzea sp. NBRC 105346]